MSIEPYACPTPCDTDCEINGWGCHQAHDVRSHREHDPDACEARTLAANLRWLLGAGWAVELGKHQKPHDGENGPEPFYSMLITDGFSRVFHGVTHGDAVARACQHAAAQNT